MRLGLVSPQYQSEGAKQALGIISNAELLRGTDTADMGYFLEEVACPLLVDAPLAMLLKACLVFRRFSRVDT